MFQTGFFNALSHSFEAIGQLFLVAFVGFYLVRRKYLSDEALGGITRLMIDWIVPAALCYSMVRGFNRDVLAEGSPILLLTIIWVPGSVLATLAFFRLFRGDGNRGADRAASALSAIHNSFYVPLPLALALTPPDLQPLVNVYIGIAVLAVNPIQWTLGSWLVMGVTAEKRQWKESLRHTVNGPVIGVVAGALLSFVPGFQDAARGEGDSVLALRMIFGGMKMLGAAMPPIAMLLVGALIARCEIRRALTLRRTATVLLMRFLIVPGLVYWSIKSGLVPAQGLVALILMLEAASPPAMNTALVARRYDGEWEVVSALLLVSNCVALLVLPFWMAAGLRLAAGF